MTTTPRAVRRWMRLLWKSPREAGFDIALVVVLQLLGIPLQHFFPPTTPPEMYAWVGGQWVGQALVAVAGLGLLARRRFPVPVMVAAAALAVAQLIAIQFGPGPLLPVNLDTDPWIPGFAPFAMYAVAAYARGRSWRIAGWVLIGVTTLIAVRPWTGPPTQVMANGLVVTAFPVVLGLYIGARRRLVGALRDRAERAEREQHLLAAQARTEERARLATEMHDVVTHRVSLMVLQAGALGVTARDDATRTAAEELRSGGTKALEELRDFVGLLRRGRDGDLGPGAEQASSTPDLSELVNESVAAGVPVRFVENGNAALMSPSVSRTAYRVVQEALTNVHKHAPGAQVRVDAHYGGERVRLTVSNTAATEESFTDLAASGSGTGLSGLRQRVELVGGTLRAGADADGGFEINAILPAYVPTGESDG